MIHFGTPLKPSGWFTQKGPESDVVVSSRIRLSRNIQGYRFPSVMEEDERAVVDDLVAGALTEYGASEASDVLKLGSMEPVQRRMLLERNQISQDFSLKTFKTFFLTGDQTVSGMVNEKDHLRIAGILPGLDLDMAYDRVNGIDDFLEKRLDYAVSIDFGYLTSDIINTGCGLRASILMHLPALVKTGLIDKALKAVVQLGMHVKGYYTDDQLSLGDMYQVANQFSIGSSEKEILEKLENLGIQLVHYERKAREELLARRTVDIEDIVYRAWGLLTHCRRISAKEAIELLAALRFGAVMGIIDVPVETVTALQFVTQKAHIQNYLQNGQDDSEAADQVETSRAQVIQKMLKEST